MGRRNFYSIPAEIARKLETFKSDYVEVGALLRFNRTKLSSYLKFGFNIENDVVLFKENPFIPPYYIGRYCKYNLLGRSITRKDLPKVTKEMPYELQDWGGHWHYGTYPRLVYQKEIWQPENVKVKFEFIGQVCDEFLVKATIDRVLNRADKSFDVDLLYFGNIIQECFASCDVFDSEMNEDDYISTMYVDWVIFPPGDVTANMIYDSIPENSKKPSKEEFIDRYNTIKETNPVQFIKGEGNFKSYFGATYSNGITVFENTYLGNALYVIYEDWAEITKKSRSELLRLDPSERKFLRIVHNRNWKEIFKRAI